jgi:sirohydrochlorin ferrochelatase
MAPAFTCFLFDNGSFRPESTLMLRALAERLGRRWQHPVQAVSLLHSTRVPAEELGGEKARLLEPALDAWFAENPDGQALLLPLFFGPSGALVDYLPEKVAAIHARHPRACTVLAAPLVLPEEAPVELAEILADRVRAVKAEKGWHCPKVVLCDHGTPLASVTAVRNRLGSLLASALGGEVAAATVASMERREGAAYAFNEPLLATRLRTAPFDTGQVVIALQFLSPGRHAGPGGDVATICAEAESEAGTLTTAMTAPIADDERLVELLVRRAEAGRSAFLSPLGGRWQNLGDFSAPNV